MKRDMELIRQILLKIEETEPFEPIYDCDIDGYEPTAVAYHVRMLSEAGFISAQVSELMRGPPSIIISHITWRGHEFLDAARDESRWRKVLTAVKEKAGSVTIAVLQELLVVSMKKATGLDAP